MEIAARRSLPSPLGFGGYKARSSGMGDLQYFKPGDMAVCTTLTRQKKGVHEASTLVEIVSIEPHQGRTVNGIRVERANEKELQSFDYVDQVTYRIHRSRDQENHGKEVTMLYGDYIPEDGVTPANYGKITQINRFDENGKPFVNVIKLDDNVPYKSIRLLPFEDYVSWSVQEKNALTEALPENKTFFQRLRNLFPS